MLPTNGEERREFQRLRLDQAIAATFDATPVSLVEVGILGARLLHATTLPTSRGDLRFVRGPSEITMRCEVARTFYGQQGWASGLRFVAAVGDSGDHLRAMLAALVVRALEQRFDSSNTRIRIGSIDGDKTVRGIDAHFLAFRLENGEWRRRPVFLPEQPPSGFTVARSEDAEEMQRLCAVYEASDEEGRRLIRMFAELSVSEVLQIPPRS